MTFHAISIPDVQLIEGEAVTVLTPAVTFDEHMDEVTEWASETVEDVLVAPSSTSDADGTARPHATSVTLRLGFPKTFSASLRGCHVVVRGQEFAVIGDPKPNTLASCPTPWWYTADVEACDG